MCLFSRQPRPKDAGKLRTCEQDFVDRGQKAGTEGGKELLMSMENGAWRTWLVSRNIGR